jgi:hypothetical protein
MGGLQAAIAQRPSTAARGEHLDGRGIPAPIGRAQASGFSERNCRVDTAQWAWPVTGAMSCHALSIVGFPKSGQPFFHLTVLRPLQPVS